MSAPLSVSDRPNLHFFKPILNSNIKQISEHNYFRHGKKMSPVKNILIGALKNLRIKY